MRFQEMGHIKSVGEAGHKHAERIALLSAGQADLRARVEDATPRLFHRGMTAE